MRIAGLIMALLVFVSPVCADESWMIVMASGADLASTEYALTKPGAQEANPFLQNQAARYALKLAGTAVLVFTYKQINERNRKWGLVFALAVTTLYVAVAAWNVSQVGGF